MIPSAAPTNKRPILSFTAFGNALSCKISRYVIKPINFPCLFTTGNFSILYWRKIFSAFFKSVPSGAMTKFSLVITSLTLRLRSVSNLKSRLVKIPTNLFVLSTIGIPPILFSFINFKASPIVAVTSSVMGSTIMPLSLRFTLRTCSACLSILMFLCKMPMPPSRASAIAKLASVTVSIAEDKIGTCN